MARIRSIHPGIFTDDAFMAASPHARTLILGLWCEAFDDGVFEWKELTLKARILPADNVSISELLAELLELRFIARFSAGGKPYGAIRNFQRFQRPKKPNSSKVLPEQMERFVGKFGTGSEPEEDLFSTGGENPPQREDGGGKREETLRKLTLSLSDPGKPARTKNKKYTDDFEAFWKLYPTDANMSKRAAFAAWQKLTDDERSLAMKAVPAYVRYLSSHPKVSTKHAENWLGEGKFEGHAARAEQLEKRFFVVQGSPEWEAWKAHRGGLSLPTRPLNGSGDGWWCESRWPPGHDPPTAPLGHPDLAASDDAAA